MSEDDSWTLAELTRAVRRIEAKLDAWNAHFVSRELHDRDIATLTDKHHDLTKWVTDIAADGERAARERSTIREDMVSRRAMWVAVGVLATLFAAASTLIAAFVH